MKKIFRAVNLKARYGYELEDFRNRENAPILPTIKGKLKDFVGHHNQNSYNGFYNLLNREVPFSNDEEIEKNDEQLVQSYTTYTNS
jgi:hypothetical protein